MTDNAAAINLYPGGESPLTALGRLKEYEAILARHSVGRIAFALEERVSIIPVQYVYTGGWIYGRTTAIGQLRELLRDRRIAFEVDEHTPQLEWCSVVVRGPLYLIDATSAPTDRRVYARAVSLIRRLLPAARSASEPTPFREQLFRIRIVEISGRTSEPMHGKKSFALGERTAAAG